MASVVLLLRNVPLSAAFFRDGLGMRLIVCTQRWAELQAADGGLRLALQHHQDGQEDAHGWEVVSDAQNSLEARSDFQSAVEPVQQPISSCNSKGPSSSRENGDPLHPPVFLSFTAADLPSLLPRLLQLGATMEGPLAHLPTGKVRIPSVRERRGQ